MEAFEQQQRRREFTMLPTHDLSPSFTSANPPLIAPPVFARISLGFVRRLRLARCPFPPPSTESNQRSIFLRRR